jgi:Kef-type K+ transport system membrane component KefB
LIILVAITGKLGGSMIAARSAGIGWRHATAIGILMNTRGLMQLVVLSIGLDLGVISSALFAMMVLMALVTTFMTTPLLELVYPSRIMERESGALGEADLAAEPVPGSPVAASSTGTL